MRIATILLLAAVSLATDAAEPDRLAEARATWERKNPSNYSFVLKRNGPFLTPMVETPVRVTVRNGRLNSVRYLRSAAGVPLGSRAPDRSGLRKSIPDLFETAAREVGRPNTETIFEFDPEYGFPTLISSYATELSDDGFSYQVSEFKITK